ncbi:MAG: translocation/assembly module TamB domain-containing protein [Pseudomonadota bacterium]
MAWVWSFLPERLWLRRTLQGLIAVCLVLLVLLGIVRVLVQTPMVHTWVEARVEALSVSGQAIEIDGLRGDLLGDFSVAEVRVRDADGVWLDARDVKLDWAPLYLLGGGLRVKAIELETLSVSRRPVLVSGDSADRDSGGSWLSDYAVRTFGIADLTIGEPVFGESLRGVLNGGIKTDIRTGLLEVVLTPETASRDRVDARLSWGGAVPFSGEIDASGPEGGLIAGLLGAEQPGRIDIRLEANGDPADWRADGGVRLGDVSYVTLSAERSRQDISADFVADLSAFGTLAPLSDRFGTEVTGRLTGSRSEPGRLTVVTSTARLEASAPLDMRTLRPDLTQVAVALDSDTPALIDVEGLTYDRLTVQGNVGRLGPAFQFVGYVESEGLSIAGAEAAMETYLGARPRVDLDLAYDTEAAELQIYGAQLAARAGAATLSGQTDLAARALSFEGVITPSADLDFIPDRASVAPVNWTARREGGGALELLASGEVDLGLGAETPWLSGPLSVQSDLVLEPTGALRVRGIDVQSEAVSAQAAGQYLAGEVEARIDLTAGPASMARLEVGGMDVGADLSGSIHDLGIEVTARPQGLVVDTYAFEQPVIRFAGRREAGELMGRFSAEAEMEEAAFDFQAEVTQQADMWRISNISGDLLGLVVAGEVSGQGAALPALSANLDVRGRSVLLPQVGGVEGNIQLTGETAAVDLRAETVAVGSVVLDAVDLTANGSRAEIEGALSLVGSAELGARTVPIRTRSDYTLKTLERLLELTLEGEIDEVPLRSIAPITLQQTEGATALLAELALLGGALNVDARQTEAGLEFGARLRDLSVTDLASLAGRETLSGRVNGDINLRGAGETLAGSAEVSLSELAQEGNDLSATSILVQADLTGDMARLTTDISSAENEITLNANAELPVLASYVPFELAPQPDGALRFDMDGSGRIEALWALVGPADMRFEGQFDITAEANGPLDQLRPRGDIMLTDAVFEDGLVGLRLKEIDVDASVTPDGVRVNAVTASGGRSGTVSGAGVYAFDGNGDVDLTLDKLNALQRSDAVATVSGELSVRRENRTAQVTGDLTFDRAEINLDRLPHGGFTTLDIRWPQRGEEEVAAEPTLPIFFDIGLQADRRIFVTGQSLSTEWGIGAQVTGSARAPELSGSARIVRGDIDVVGQEFRFVDSFVRFNGPPPDAILSMRAEQEAADLLAYFAVTGTIAEPEFSLGSDPALPDDEVLSRVLFGVSPSQLSGLQAAQLAAAVARLTGSGGPDVVGSLEDALDVDRLDFGVAEDGTASVGAGKYVAEDVYVEVRTGTRGDPGLGIEWTPRRNVEIGAELGSEAAPRFTIQWKRDFDFGREDDAEPDPELDAED